MSGPPPSDDGARRTYHRARRIRKAICAIAVLALGTLAWLRWRPFRIAIEGASMEPALAPGDWALAVRVGRVRPGDVVVLEHPERPGFELVKRVVVGAGGAVSSSGTLGTDELWVQGDASDRSTDSRSFGPVWAGSVRARVVLVWWPPTRWRSV